MGGPTRRRERRGGPGKHRNTTLEDATNETHVRHLPRRFAAAATASASPEAPHSRRAPPPLRPLTPTLTQHRQHRCRCRSATCGGDWSDAFDWPARSSARWRGAAATASSIRAANRAQWTARRRPRRRRHRPCRERQRQWQKQWQKQWLCGVRWRYLGFRTMTLLPTLTTKTKTKPCEKAQYRYRWWPWRALLPTTSNRRYTHRRDDRPPSSPT